MYKEVTVKKYFCGRCGKEVKPPKTGAIISNINGSPFNIKEDGLNYFSAESKSAKLLRELREIKKGE